MTQKLNQAEQHFHSKGWVVFDLPDPKPAFTAREILLAELRRLLNDSRITLETYHKSAIEDDHHFNSRIKLTEFFWRQRLGQNIINANLDFLKEFVGPDLNVQTKPYLRITRPGKPQDNIHFHRDTFYGTSPFELSVIVPFVDIPAECSLSVLSGSHVRPDSDFPYTQMENQEIVRGSAKHKVLGFLYAPKYIDPAYLQGMEPIPLKLGQALIFILSLIHGSIENRGSQSRWSSDIRIVNSNVPIDLSARPDYYEPLCRSVVTDSAHAYLKSVAGSK